MPTNVSPEYTKAEKKYLASRTDEEKLGALEEMIKTMPKHKSAENLRANIRTRYKKLKEKLRIKQKKAKLGKKGIKKSELQAILVGLTNSGKSSILSVLTNSKPEISSVQFTTKTPNLGILNYGGVQIQLVDQPAVESEYFDQSIANITGLLIIIITNPKELEKILLFLDKAKGNKLIVLNKIDLLSNEEQRKIISRLKSNRYEIIAISCKTKQGIEELKEKIFKSFDILRIYTKEPHKAPTKIPIILPKNSTVKDAIKKIHRNIQIKEAKVTGPSSKFPNQKVGLNHILKDKDILEFHTS